MANSQNDIPAWLQGGVPEGMDIEKVLTPSREEMYKALELYHAHVKYVITIMFSLMTAMFAILGLSEKLGGAIIEAETIKTVVGVFLIVVCLVAPFAIGILYRYYFVYVSALVFAVRVHLGSPLKTTHPWFLRLIKRAQKWSNVRDELAFIKKRTRSLTDTFMLYVYIIVFLALLSLFCGLKILGII
jgi:hypothetical protein